MRPIALTLLALLLLPGCGGDVADPDDTSPPSTPLPPTADGAWQLVDGVDVVAGWPITLTVEGVRVGGRAACNQYGGVVGFEGSSLEIGSIAQTEMACEPAAVMDSEQAFLAALVDVDTWELADGFLLLRGSGIELRFEPVPPVAGVPFADTEWSLDSILQGEVATTPHSGSEATLLFGSDGSLAATTGCRLLTGRWIESGGAIQITELGAEGECPADLAAQDSSILSVLGGTPRPLVSGDRLTLTAAGNEALEYLAR